MYVILKWGDRTLRQELELFLSGSPYQMILWNHSCVLGYKLYKQYSVPRSYEIISIFKRTRVETIGYFILIDHSSKKLSCATAIKQNQEYLKL